MNTPLTQEPAKHRITLDFDDAETLQQALEYIGETDAPVMITNGVVESKDGVFGLWDDFEAAINYLEEQQ